MAKSWYVNLGGDDPTLFSNYARVTTRHQGLCGNEIFVIYANGEGFHPDDPLSPNILKYIKDGLATGAIQPEKPAGAKKYVYLRYREP